MPERDRRRARERPSHGDGDDGPAGVGSALTSDRFFELGCRVLLDKAGEQERLGLNAAAERLYRQAAAAKPQAGTELGSVGVRLRLEAYSRLARLFERTGRTRAAIVCYRDGLRVRRNADFYNRLAQVLHDIGDLDGAQAAYLDALQLRPDDGSIRNNLGNVYKDRNEYEEAISCYQQALTCKCPEESVVRTNLARVLHAVNRHDEAMAELRQAVEIDPRNHSARLTLVMNHLAEVYVSEEHLLRCRDSYALSLKKLAEEYGAGSEEMRSEAASAVGSIQPFFLPYQGRCNRGLQSIYGQMICRLMSSRYPQWTHPIKPPPLESTRKVRVGFVSGHFFDHSVWKIPTKGWMTTLDRTRFEIFAYHTGDSHDRETVTAEQACTKFFKGPRTIEEWVNLIGNDGLDVIIFPELGMHPLPIQLACLRLAPLQMTTVGHPETTGLPTIDYYLSSDLMEPENGQEHYTETLIRLPNLSVYYEPQDVSPTAVNVRELGLDDEDVICWSCQSLFKYLPQHDDVFPSIAQRAPQARFLFIGSPSGEPYTEVFRGRLKKAFDARGMNCEIYCRFLPRLTPQSFASVAASADVFLDNIGWSGFNSALESLAYDIPLVTCAGEFMRGRHSLGLMRRMGIDETVAETKAEYIEIAARLINDIDDRHQLADKISHARHQLYRDLEPVRALEAFLLSAVAEKARTAAGVYGQPSAQ